MAMSIVWTGVDRVQVNVTPGVVGIHFAGGGLLCFEHRGAPRRVLGTLLETFEERRESFGGYVCPPIDATRVVYLQLRPVCISTGRQAEEPGTSLCCYQVWYETAGGESLPVSAATTDVAAAWYAALRNAAYHGETEVVA